MMHKLADTQAQSVWECPFNFCMNDYWRLDTRLVKECVACSSHGGYTAIIEKSDVVPL